MLRRGGGAAVMQRPTTTTIIRDTRSSIGQRIQCRHFHPNTNTTMMHNQLHQNYPRVSSLTVLARNFSSSWSGRGHDFLGDAFLGGDRPKVLLESIAPSGFDVSNIIKKVDPNEIAEHGAIHMTGSILAFPNACFLCSRALQLLYL